VVWNKGDVLQDELVKQQHSIKKYKVHTKCAFIVTHPHHGISRPGRHSDLYANPVLRSLRK
jgi:hypothetical protein